MKKNTFVCLLVSIFALLNISCLRQDDADDFVGTYSVSTQTTATFAGMTQTFASSGIMNITKISASRVKTSGWFDTYGEVIGNALYLESCSYNSSDYQITEVFSVGYLNGNVLTFSSTSSGLAFLSGNWNTYYSTGQHTGIKQQ